MDGIEKITGRIAADTEAEIASIQAEARRQGAGVIVTSVGNRLGLPYDKIFAL